MKKIAFIHIPRTSGKSFWGHISRYLPGPISLNQNWSAYINDNRSGSYRLMGGYVNCTIVGYVGDDVDLVTMLRDPIDRTISLFDHMCNHPVFDDWRKRHMGDGISLERFLENGETNYQVRNAICRYLGSEYGPANVPLDDDHAIDHLLRWSVENESDQTVYERAISKLEEFSFVGFKEEHAKSVKAFLFSCGVSVEARDREHKDHAGSVGEEILETIREMNKYDIELHKLAKETRGL